MCDKRGRIRRPAPGSFKKTEKAMTKEEIDDILEDRGISALRFEVPAFDDAVIGISHDDRLVYDYDKMVACLVAEGMTDEEAVEFIDCNTLRVIPYEAKAPIVMYNLEN